MTAITLHRKTPCNIPINILEVASVMIKVGSFNHAANIPFSDPKRNPIIAANKNKKMTGPVYWCFVAKLVTTYIESIAIAGKDTSILEATS